MFNLVSKYKPTGDQPEAIKELVQGIKEGKKEQVLLGATGTGKTFTIANVIEKTNKPTLVLAHNKTLAGQLYNELKELFPENRVEYFVSYYDYYQPEATMLHNRCPVTTLTAIAHGAGGTVHLYHRDHKQADKHHPDDGVALHPCHQIEILLQSHLKPISLPKNICRHGGGIVCSLFPYSDIYAHDIRVPSPVP